jgi:hypothetical protein
MTRHDPEEKRLRMLEKYLGPLMERREFLAAFGITTAGLTLQEKKTAPSKVPEPVFVLTKITDSDQALVAAYWVFWEAANENVEDHDSTGLLSGVPRGYQGTMTGAPMSARKWLLWRMRAAFRKRFGQNPDTDTPGTDTTNWDNESAYVFQRSARIGYLARKEAGSGMVKLNHVVKAVNSVSLTATEKARAKGKDGKLIPFDLWCTL